MLNVNKQLFSHKILFFNKAYPRLIERGTRGEWRAEPSYLQLRSRSHSKIWVVINICKNKSEQTIWFLRNFNFWNSLKRKFYSKKSSFHTINYITRIRFRKTVKSAELITVWSWKKFFHEPLENHTKVTSKNFEAEFGIGEKLSSW